MEAHIYEGPLPPPEIMERYREIVPGLPETIVSLWTKQSQHRMEMEKLDKKALYKQLKTVVWLDLTGKAMAFLLLISLVVFAFYSMGKGQPWGAVVAIAGSIATVFGAPSVYEHLKKNKKR